ncbi:MAG: DUF2345 domain-containing protein, partial [Negativicutes bacterium]|nr:DUF2345 domain-containing protein [Negativicutes bacterium]
KTTAAADKKVTIASTSASLNASAKGHLLATAQGAYLKIEGGDIQLHAPGSVTLHASQKNLTGPASAAVVLPSLSVRELPPMETTSFSQRVNLAGAIGKDPETNALYAQLPYEVFNENGQRIATGTLDQDGNTNRLFTQKQEKLKVVLTHGDWMFFQDVEHG